MKLQKLYRQNLHKKDYNRHFHKTLSELIFIGIYCRFTFLSFPFREETFKKQDGCDKEHSGIIKTESFINAKKDP